MTRIYDSDIARAIFEAISNTSTREDSHQAISSLRADLSECDFELSEANATVTIYTKTEDFKILVYKTRITKPL